MRWILGAIALVLAALTSWLWFSPPSLTLSDTGAEWTCTSLASGAPHDVGLLPAQDESTHAMIVKWIVATGTDQSSITTEEISQAWSSVRSSCDDARLNRLSGVTLSAIATASFGIVAAVSGARGRPRAATV